MKERKRTKDKIAFYAKENISKKDRKIKKLTIPVGQTARPGFLGQIGQDPESLEDDNEDDVDVSAAAAAVV